MKTKLVTDKDLFELAQGRILTSYGDFELDKYQPYITAGKPTLPAVVGGLFDTDIFGSPYDDRCACGITTGKGNTCNACHTHINTDEESATSVALIKSPVYYILPTSMAGFVSFVNSNFKGFDVSGNKPWSGTSIPRLYTSFFTYVEDENGPRIERSNVEDTMNPDFTNLSIEGIIKIFEQHKRDKLNELLKYVHKYILVRPRNMRPWSYTYKTWLGRKTLDMHQLNFQYKSLIYLSTELVNGINFKDLSAEDIVYSLSTIRLAITKICTGISNLVTTSKASSIRQGFGVRVPNSGRGVALADPTLDIDHVSIPIGMGFEVFRDQFFDWVRDNYKLIDDEINNKILSKDKEIFELFKKFVAESDLYVMINRAPTLYKLSQLAFKVTLNEGSYIGYSLMATTPLNLDFDGDTIAVYEIPEHLKSRVQGMLPSKLDRYMKSDEEVIIPKQETLIGLMIATKWDEANDRTQEVSVNDLSKLDDMYMDGKFDSNDLITIGSKVNTYGRFKLTSILGFPIEEEITNKNISKLITKLKSTDRFTEKMKEMQEFALKVCTFESTSDLSLENLSKSTSKIDDPYINDLSNEELYDKFLKMSDDANPLSDSLKGDKGAISAMTKPQAIIIDGKVTLASDSMVGVLPANEYRGISAEFRKVQQDKVTSVGDSGYLSRQIWTAMSSLTYSPNIVNPVNQLKITCDIDGVRYSNGQEIRVKKGEEYLVDSVIYNNDSTVYANDLYKGIEYRDGHLIGIDYGMQLSEGVTQSILKLKHAGRFVTYSKFGLLQAEGKTKVTHDDNYLYIDGNKFLKSPKFKFVDKNKVDYNKGDLIGMNPVMAVPTTGLYLLMRLVGALGSTSISIKPKRFSNLYSVNSGTVKMIPGVVLIGDIGYHMPEESLCLVYDGQHVEVGEKLFSGPLDYRSFSSKNSGLGINNLYKVFYSEIMSLVKIKGVMVEFLFKAIHDIDPVNNYAVFKGVSNAIDSSKDLLTSLTLGFIKNKISSYIASNSDDLGDSSIINIAYQLNGLNLGLSADKLLNEGDKESKKLNESN